jgi:hypothetical protein
MPPERDRGAIELYEEALETFGAITDPNAERVKQ